MTDLNMKKKEKKRDSIMILNDLSRRCVMPVVANKINKIRESLTEGEIKK